MGLFRKIAEPHDPFKDNEKHLPPYDPSRHEEWMAYRKARDESRARQNEEYLRAHQRDGARVGVLIGAPLVALSLLVSQLTPSTANGSEIVCEGKRKLDAIPGTTGNLRTVVSWKVEGVTDENLPHVVRLVAKFNNLDPDDTLEDPSDFPLTLPDTCYQEPVIDD